MFRQWAISSLSPWLHLLIMSALRSPTTQADYYQLTRLLGLFNFRVFLPLYSLWWVLTSSTDVFTHLPYVHLNPLPKTSLSNTLVIHGFQNTEQLDRPFSTGHQSICILVWGHFAFHREWTNRYLDRNLVHGQALYSSLSFKATLVYFCLIPAYCDDPGVTQGFP